MACATSMINEIDQKPIFLSDRKSTRLNSSHRCISYAVFCLKKKNDHHLRVGIGPEGEGLGEYAKRPGVERGEGRRRTRENHSPHRHCNPAVGISYGSAGPAD